LWPQVARRFAERPVDQALAGQERALNHDLRVRWHHQPLAPRLRWHQAQRFLEVGADDLVLVGLEAASEGRAHVERRVVTEDRRDRAFLAALLIGAEDLPQVAGRYQAAGQPRTLDLHA